MFVLKIKSKEKENQLLELNNRILYLQREKERHDRNIMMQKMKIERLEIIRSQRAKEQESLRRNVKNSKIIERAIRTVKKQ